MTRVRRLMVLAMALALGAAFACAAQAQAAEGAGGGPRGGFRRSSLLGLLSLEQVQKEMKLSDEQAAKVKKLVEKLRAEIRQQYTALRKIEDRAQRRAKMTELTEQFDGKVREQLRDVLKREQMMRLYQIRMQVRPVVDSLSNRYVARRLKLTEEQQKKVAEISKQTQAKESELFGAMRNATNAQRSEAFQKLRQLRSAADEKALAVLTAEQKEAFEKMKGEKIKLGTQRGRQ
jgi:Spy/CpxP family protein refolding chaperone